MILNLPESYCGECSCEVAILSCSCALIGAKESPDVRIRVPWLWGGMDKVMTFGHCYMILTIRNHARESTIEKEVFGIVFGLFLNSVGQRVPR